MMRTTLAIDDDVLSAAKEMAAIENGWWRSIPIFSQVRGRV
jgi:hypothetical protein